MPGHAYTTYTTTLEHTPCTEVIGYTCAKLSQHTSCSSSVDSGHNASYTEPLEYNSSMEDLLHVHTPYTSTLGRNSYIFMHSRTNTRSVGTQAPQPTCIPFTNLPESPCTPAEHLPLHLQNLITIHKVHRILLQYIRYTEPQSTYVISIGNFYLTPIKHMCKFLFTISNTAVALATLDHTLRILAATSPPHTSNQTY